MRNKPLEKYAPADIEAAIRHAREYAEALGVPLTAERLAAELDMDLALFHRIVQGQYPAGTPALRRKADMIRHAAGEATASVVEHAMRRGSGSNMHLLYLKNNAGYDRAAAETDADGHPPVIFVGEEDIPE